MHGNLDEFPYERPDQHGLFRIDAPFRAARFDPSPWPPRRTRFGKLENWPIFEDIDGRFLIDNALLLFDIDAGRYRDVKVDRVRGEIIALADRESPFLIHGTARGPLADMVRYLNESPVPDSIDRATERIRTTGDAHLALTLTLPRHPHPVTTLEGRVTLAGNDLTYASVPTVTGLNGALDFTGRSARMVNVTGQWLGGGVRGNGGREPGRQHRGRSRRAGWQSTMHVPCRTRRAPMRCSISCPAARLYAERAWRAARPAGSPTGFRPHGARDRSCRPRSTRPRANTCRCTRRCAGT